MARWLAARMQSRRSDPVAKADESLSLRHTSSSQRTELIVGGISSSESTCFYRRAVDSSGSLRTTRTPATTSKHENGWNPRECLRAVSSEGSSIKFGMRSAARRVALVTGASRGLGFETACQLLVSCSRKGFRSSWLDETPQHSSLEPLSRCPQRAACWHPMQSGPTHTAFALTPLALLPAKTRSLGSGTTMVD